MTTPLLSDPEGEPRFAYRGDAKREKPIYSREQFGPWRCDVHVTPITGMRQGYPLLEIRIAWQRGPALDESLGAAPPGGMAAVDTFYVDRQARDMMLTASQAAEVAVELATRAGDLLNDGVKPRLPELARAIVLRAK